MAGSSFKASPTTPPSTTFSSDTAMRLHPPRRAGLHLLGVIRCGAAQVDAGARTSSPERRTSAAILLQGRPPLGFCCDEPHHPLAADTHQHQGPGFAVQEGAAWTSSSQEPLPDRDVADYEVPADADLTVTRGSRPMDLLLGGVAASDHHHHPAAHRLQATKASPYQYLHRRYMSSGAGGREGHAPRPQASYWRKGRIVVKRPAFLPTPTHFADRLVAHPRQTWRLTERVPGTVQENCIDATDLHVRFWPVQYLKTHPLMESVQILGEASGECVWKFTESGKYTTKSLIDLIDTFHDVGCCVPTLSLDSVVINSAGRFQLIRSKTVFADLSPNGVTMDYRNAAYLLEELVAASMGNQMVGMIPKDIQMLLRDMKTDGYRLRELLKHHVSLLPLQNRSAVFMAFFNYFDRYIPNADHTLKHKIEQYIPYRKLWAVIASNNSFLVEWFKYQDFKAGIKIRGKWYEFLVTVRHVISHKFALLAKGKVYQAEEVEIMLQALYPELLPMLHEFYWKNNRLNKFNLEAYFMSRKVTQEWPRGKGGYTR